MDKARAIEVAQAAQALLIQVNQTIIEALCSARHEDYDEEILFSAVFMGGLSKVIDCSVHSTTLRIAEQEGPLTAARFRALVQSARDNANISRVEFTENGPVMDPDGRLEPEPPEMRVRATAPPSPN